MKKSQVQLLNMCQYVCVCEILFQTLTLKLF